MSVARVADCDGAGMNHVQYTLTSFSHMNSKGKATRPGTNGTGGRKEHLQQHLAVCFPLLLAHPVLLVCLIAGHEEAQDRDCVCIAGLPLSPCCVSLRTWALREV